MKITIININQHSSSFTFTLLFVKRAFRQMKVIDYVTMDAIKTKQFFNMDAILHGKEIKKVMKANRFGGSKLVVNLNLTGIFIEDFDMPKLGKREMDKAIELQLEKIYSQFQTRFVFDTRVFSKNQNIKLVRTAFYDLKKYRFFLFLMKQISKKVMTIALAPCALYQALETYELISFKESFFFINVSKAESIILIHKNGSFAYHIFDYGILPKHEDGSQNDHYDDNMFLVEKIATETMRVLYNQEHIEIKSIYINIEGNDNMLGSELFSEQLNRKVLPLKGDFQILAHLCAVGALLPSNGYSFSFPKKIPKERKSKSS